MLCPVLKSVIWVPSGLCGLTHMGPICFLGADALGPQMVCPSWDPCVIEYGTHMGPIYCPCDIAHVMPSLEISDMGPIWAPSGLCGLTHMLLGADALGPQMVCPYGTHVSENMGPMWAPYGLATWGHVAFTGTRTFVQSPPPPQVLPKGCVG